MPTVPVNLGPRSYEIVIDEGDLGSFARQAAGRSNLAIIVVDSNTAIHGAALAESLTGAGFQVEQIAIPAGEASKCLGAAEHLYDRLADLNADRRTLVVAVGGGVVGDLAGFVAATYNRGLPLLMAPTSLLAMVDSSVGGKVGINHAKGKNLIGAFHQPAGVWIDTALLASLPQREFRSGLAEVVKYGIILDAEFFAWLERNADAVLSRDTQAIRYIVAESCRLKAGVVERDEREETGLRMILNYGHTFAHAFETAAGYGAWLHGEAVSAGMVCASKLAVQLGLIPDELTQRQVGLLTKFHLPVKPQSWPAEQLIAIMRRDKKSQAGELRFVLPRRLGEVAAFDHVSEDDVRRALG